jgi:hypothetical protein
MSIFSGAAFALFTKLNALKRAKLLTTAIRRIIIEILLDQILYGLVLIMARISHQEKKKGSKRGKYSEAVMRVVKIGIVFCVVS